MDTSKSLHPSPEQSTGREKECREGNI